MTDKPLHQMSPEESYRAGVSPILALEARIRSCKQMADLARDAGDVMLASEWDTAWGAYSDALALIQPTATISERANQR